MRLFIALVVVAYFVGVGVVLAPTIRGSWDTVPASELTANVTQQLPYAAAWPARAYRSVVGEPAYEKAGPQGGEKSG
jgi:hypothetical protein